MAEVEAASAAEVLAALPRNAGLADVADRLKSLQSWLYEPRLVTRTLARMAASQASTALHVLNYMQSQEIEPNAFHYTAVMTGCARSGSWRAVGSLLQQMAEQQIQRDSVTFNTAINACGKSAKWETSVLLLECMVDSNLTLGTDTVNSVMGACTAAGQWEWALWMFETTLRSSSPDAITFCSALAACDKGSQWRRSLQVLASGASSSVQLDNFAYSAVISACATAERWEFACGLLENLWKKAVLADLVTHGAVLKALGAGKEWAMALAMFFDRNIDDELSEVTQVTCNSVISACSTGSQWQHACLLLNSMPDLGVSPEDVSYNTAISACVRGNAWQHGLMMFNQMHQAFVEPDHISFNSALSACHKGSQWQLGLTLLEEMSECSLQPDEFCVTTALSACELAGWQLCLQVLWKLEKRTDVTPIMFGVLMSACERDSAWAAALATLDAIISDDLIPDALHAGSAANALRKRQGPEAALELLRQIKELWSDAWATAEHFPGPRWEASSKIIQVGQGVVACFKPAGIATEVFVEDLANEVAVSKEAFSIVSRLDHPTSGILMVALGLQGSPAANWLQGQFASRLVDKKYLCLCEGLPLGSVGATGHIFAPLAADEVRDCMVVPEAGRSGRESWTMYRVLARYTAPEASPYELMLLEVKPITGRTHQIRVHMAYLGRPLVGDLTYGAKELSILPCERLFLHCRRVQLRDFSDQKFCAVASLPVELRQVLAKLQPMPAASSRKKRPLPGTVPNRQCCPHPHQ